MMHQLGAPQRREQLGPLKYVREPEPRALPRAKAGDVLIGKPYRAAGGRDLSGEDVDERRLPRPVRSDHRAALALGDLERHAVERDDAAERAAELADLDHRCCTQ